MDLIYDLDKEFLVTKPGASSKLTRGDTKRGDVRSITVTFVRGSVVVVPPGAMVEMIFVAKRSTSQASPPILLTNSWTFNPTLTRWEGIVTQDSARILDILSSSTTTSLLAEFSFTTDEIGPLSSQIFTISLENDVWKGSEGTPLSLPSPDAWLVSRRPLPPADGNIYAFRNGAPVKLKPDTEWFVFATHVADVSNWSVNGGTPILDSNGNVTFDTPETVTAIYVPDGLTADSVIDATMCPQLDNLTIEVSPITTPPIVAGLAMMQALSITNTPITAPPVLTGLANLTYLDLSYTAITTPPVLTGLTALASIYLTNVPITAPPVLTGLTSLYELYLSYTNITTPPVLTGLTSLQYFYCTRNNITTPPVLTGLTSLTDLDLSDTLITTPPVLAGLTLLSSVSLHHTNITTPPVLTGLSSLFYLDLSHTDIATPPVLIGMPQLNVLYLGGTPITTPPTLSGAPMLSELGLDGTNITTPPVVTGLNYLQFVYMNDTAITSVTAINNFFNQLDTAASVIPVSGGYVDISGGTNAVPTAPSLAARSHLIDTLYWTIVTN